MSQQTQEQEYYQINNLSNSALSVFDYSPELYYKKYITKELKDKKSDSLSFGSLFHCLKLEPELFEQSYYISGNNVEGLMGKFIFELANLEGSIEDNYELAYTLSGFKISLEKVIENYNKSEVYKQYYVDLVNSKDKIIISREDYNKALRLVKLDDENKQWSMLDNIEWDEYKELPIFFEYENIACKSKLDRLFISKDGLHAKYIDYKTDSQNNIYNYHNSFAYWKTYKQLAFYNQAIIHFCKEKYDTVPIVSHYIVPLDTKNEKTIIYNISQEYITKGIKEINQNISNLKWHIENNLWEHPKYIYDALSLQNNILILNEPIN
jgi:hypothetical protein